MAHEHHETPKERERSLNLWLIFVVVLVLIAVAVLALVLILRDDHKGGGGGSSTTTTTTVARAPRTPEQFAKALYGDWQVADRSAAATVASTEAVDQLFQFAYQPLHTNAGPTDLYTFQGCEGAAGSEICTWSGQDNAQIVMMVRNLTGGLPVLVVNVTRQGG